MSSNILIYCILTRLLDLGLKRITEIIMNMAELSEMCVNNAIESYETGIIEKNQVFEWSEKLEVSQLEVSDLSIGINFKVSTCCNRFTIYKIMYGNCLWFF